MTGLIYLRNLNVLISEEETLAMIYTFGKTNGMQDNGDKDTYWMATDAEKNSYMVILTEQADGGATLMVNCFGQEDGGSSSAMYYLKK